MKYPGLRLVRSGCFFGFRLLDRAIRRLGHSLLFGFYTAVAADTCALGPRDFSIATHRHKRQRQRRYYGYNYNLTIFDLFHSTVYGEE